MAKQDAIIEHPQAEKETATNGVCKDKQLKPHQHVANVASLAIGETPRAARQHDSPRTPHRPLPQQQQQLQLQPSFRRLSSGLPPDQSLPMLQEQQHPLKSTIVNKLTTSSPAGDESRREMVDKPLDDGPSPINSIVALAADLDPTSVQTLHNSQDTKTNAGLARWHSWVTQQTKNRIIGNAIDITSSRDRTLDITPSSLMQYVEAVVLPLERASSLSSAEPSTSITTDQAQNGQGASSVIETYLKPVLQLWQHQYLHQEEQQRQEQQQQRQSYRHPDPSSSSSSVTLSSEPKSFHESLSDDRAVVLNVQHAIRQQDQLQRLIQLEKSHQDTALVISQLQDQLQRLIDDRALQRRLHLHSHQEKDQNVLRASDNESGSKGAVSLATLPERHTVHRGYSPSPRRHHQRQQCQQLQTNGYYGRRSDIHRADELIEVIAKGLEEYHARATFERPRQRSGTDTSTAGHDHSSWHHIDLSGENAVELSHHPQSPHDSAVDYHQYEQEQETVDRSLGSQQRERTIYYEDRGSPMQLHHHLHDHNQQQRTQTEQIHAVIHHEDLLEVPSLHALHDRPARSRKRSSSMSGPGGLHKENIKQARSCSPRHPRTTSDALRTEPEGYKATTAASVVSDSHTPSQPPTDSLGKNGRHGLRPEERHNSPKNITNLESSASSTAAASLTMLHFGSVERARHHSVSLQHVDHHTRQQSVNPYTTSDQHTQVQGDTFLDGYPSHPQGHGFNYTSAQTTRVAPPPYGEDDYRSYPEHSHPPMRHHSHPNQSYPHLGDMAVQSMTQSARYELQELETQVSSCSHPTDVTKTFTETQLPVFRGKHTKNQESFSFINRSEPVQHRRESYPSPSQPTSALISVSKPHPYQRDESRMYYGYEYQQQQQQHQPLQSSRRHDPSDDDIKSPHLQLKEYQHQHPQHHQYHQQLQQQQQQPQKHHQLQQHNLYQPPQQQHHQQQQHHHSSHHHDMHHQQSLQASSTSSPPLSSSLNQHQHQHHPPPPIYVMNRQVNTVPELWKEWTVGLGPGSPSIRQLEAQYGPSWRTSSSAANFFSRRLRIIHEIQRAIDYEGLTEEEAVNRLEARREQGVVVPGSEGHSATTSSSDTTGGGSGMSLHRLSEILRKKQL